MGPGTFPVSALSPPCSYSGRGGNNAPIEAHFPKDNISVSTGTEAKQVSLVGAESLLYSSRGKTSEMRPGVPGREGGGREPNFAPCSGARAGGTEEEIFRNGSHAL